MFHMMWGLPKGIAFENVLKTYPEITDFTLFVFLFINVIINLLP
jgi:hypothetical protein